MSQPPPERAASDAAATELPGTTVESGSTDESDGDEEFGPRTSIGRNLVHMGTSQLLTWGLSSVLLVVQPRYLGVETIGELRLAVSLWAIVQMLVGLGTAQYLTLAISRNRRAGLALVGPVIVLKVIVFVVSSAAMGVFVLLGDHPDRFVAIMALLGVSNLFLAISQTLNASFTGLERMSVIAVATVVNRLFGTVAAITILLVGGDVVSMVVVLVVAQMISFGILVNAYRKVTSLQFRGWRGQARPILAGSVVFLVAGLSLVVYQQVDTIVLAILVDDEALGWYATGDVLFATLLFPVTIVMGSLFPVIGRLHEHDPDELVRLIRRTTRILLVVTVPIGLGTVVMGPSIAVTFLGEDFRETGDVLMVLGPVIILTFATVLLGKVATGTGRQAFWTKLMIVGIVATIPLDLLFVPWADRVFSNGAIGGAMAYAATESMMVLVGLWKISPYLVERGIASRAVRVAVAGAVMMAASWPLRDRFIVLPVVVGMLAYLVAVAALRVLNADERELLMKVVRRVRSLAPGRG